MTKKLLVIGTLFLVAGFAIIANNVFASTSEGTLSTAIQTGLEGVTKAAPTVSPAAGDYHATQTVTLTAAGATKICYTVDGTTEPSCATSTTCTAGTALASGGTVSLTSTTTVKSAGCYADASTGPVATSAYTLTCATSSVTNGTVAAYSSCAITCNSGYTISGSTCVSSGGGGGGGSSSNDTSAPSISGIEITVYDTKAVISWATGEASQSWVVYGLNTNYGSEEKVTTYITSHFLTITGLSPQTVYHYQLKSKDSSGNIGTYTDKTFTTLAVGQEAAQQVAEETVAVTPTKPYSQMTSAELQAEISRILVLISQLQKEIALMQPGATAITGVPATFLFKNSLEFGDILIDVKYLQLVLNSMPDTSLAISGVGSSGHETNYFGTLTKEAVVKFQEKYMSDCLTPIGLTSGTGFVGSLTKGKLNELLGQ